MPHYSISSTTSYRPPSSPSTHHRNSESEWYLHPPPNVNSSVSCVPPPPLPPFSLPNQAIGNNLAGSSPSLMAHLSSDEDISPSAQPWTPSNSNLSSRSSPDSVHRACSPGSRPSSSSSSSTSPLASRLRRFLSTSSHRSLSPRTAHLQLSLQPALSSSRHSSPPRQSYSNPRHQGHVNFVSPLSIVFSRPSPSPSRPRLQSGGSSCNSPSFNSVRDRRMHSRNRPSHYGPLPLSHSTYPSPQRSRLQFRQSPVLPSPAPFSQRQRSRTPTRAREQHHHHGLPSYGAISRAHHARSRQGHHASPSSLSPRSRTVLSTIPPAVPALIMLQERLLQRRQQQQQR